MTNLLLKDSIVGIVKVDRFVFRGLKMRLFPILFSVFFLTALYAPSAQADVCRYEITFYTYTNPVFHVQQRGYFMQQLDFALPCSNLAAVIRTHLDSTPLQPDGTLCFRYTYHAGEGSYFEPTFSLEAGSCANPIRPIKPALDSTADVAASSGVDARDSDPKIATKQSVRE